MTITFTAFSSFTFRTETVGADGQSLANVRALYGSDPTLWTNNDDYLSMESNRQGIQIWTVPKTGYYKFDVYGAGGNDGSNNLGGNISGYSLNLIGYIYLTMNEKIHIACGQNGGYFPGYSSGNPASYVGGHGGTFVVRGSNNVPLIITGGASGANYAPQNPAKNVNGISVLGTFNSGIAYSTDENGNNYLINGYGGVVTGEVHEAGAGFYGDAINGYGDNIWGVDSYATAAKSWANGLTGGKSGTNSETNAAEGGFGGGAVSHGGTYIRSGGGGGYSGGGGSG